MIQQIKILTNHKYLWELQDEDMLCFNANLIVKKI